VFQYADVCQVFLWKIIAFDSTDVTTFFEASMLVSKSFYVYM